MNSVLAWVKTNWLIVVFCAVMVLSLVAGFIGSDMWASAQRKGSDQGPGPDVAGAGRPRVNYSIPTLTPDETAVTDSGPPNAAKTVVRRSHPAARSSRPGPWWGSPRTSTAGTSGGVQPPREARRAGPEPLPRAER